MKQGFEPWFGPRTAGWGWKSVDWKGTAFIFTALMIVVVASLIIRPVWLASMATVLLLIVFVAFLRLVGTRPGWSPPSTRRAPEPPPPSGSHAQEADRA